MRLELSANVLYLLLLLNFLNLKQKLKRKAILCIYRNLHVQHWQFILFYFSFLIYSPAGCFIIKYNRTGELNYSVIFIEMFFTRWWLTCGDQSELVLLVCHLLLLDISPREEESHHPLEELIHQLDGERHYVHLTEQTSHFLANHHMTVISPRVMRRHLKVFLHRDSSHRGAHFAEEPEGELAPGLTDALRAEHHLRYDGEMVTS